MQDRDTALDALLKEAIPLKPADRADLVESSEALESAHYSAANQGSSAVPDAQAEVDLHYICFVKSQKNNHLYELDGIRKGPLDRGYLGPEDDVLSERALQAVRRFIQREEGKNINFSLVALAPALDWADICLLGWNFSRAKSFQGLGICTRQISILCLIAASPPP